MNVTALETISTVLTVVLNLTLAVFPAVDAAEVTEQKDCPVAFDAEQVPLAITADAVSATKVGVTDATGFPRESATVSTTAAVAAAAVLPRAAPAEEARFRTCVAVIFAASP